MTSPIFDFSHLTPEERIALAEQLWDSLESASIDPSDSQIAELRRRRADLAADGDPGRPTDEILAEIRERGG
jgi:putative addiction module component (TIGR02574 family)